MVDLNSANMELAAGAATAGSTEDAVKQILALRKTYGASGQRGEDVELIRTALVQRGASLRSTTAELP
jgi:hypothetical protein